MALPSMNIRPTNTKADFLPLCSFLTTTFHYAGLSCPSAWRNKVKFGHWPTMEERLRIESVNSV